MLVSTLVLVSQECLLLVRRASDFEIAVLAANRIDRKILIDAVPGISPWIRRGIFLAPGAKLNSKTNPRRHSRNPFPLPLLPL